MPRVVFVGEAPSHDRASGKPFPALWPFAPGSGARLCGYLGVTPKQFWRRRLSGDWMTTNLFEKPVEKWLPGRARKQAYFVSRDLWVVGEPYVMVLLGRQVADAFNHRYDLFNINRFVGWTLVDGKENAWCAAVMVPHPSGRSRLWNDRRNVAKFRQVMTELGVL